MRTLLLESVAGIAGDMFSAAFADAGLVSPEALQDVPALLGLEGIEIVLSREERAGLSATGLEVRAARGDGGWGAALAAAGGEVEPGHHGHPQHAAHGPHARWSALDRILAGSALEPGVKELSRRVFRLLADAEGRAHGVPPEEVAFHELGAVDGVVDVAMAATAVAAVAPARVVATPLVLGRGRVTLAHGEYPVPPPAVAVLATGFPVAPMPQAITAEHVELSTPTGVAILRALDPEPIRAWPAGTPLAHGYGAGRRDLGAYPNVFRVALFEVDALDSADPAGSAGAGLPYAADRVVEIACTVDDQTAERSGWMLERALELGALDAWATPVVGKKSRPAVVLSLLVRADERDRFVDWVLRTSSSFGVRFREWERRKLVRHTERRETAAGTIRFEVGSTTAGERVKEKPELEDLRRAWRDDPAFDPSVDA